MLAVLACSAHVAAGARSHAQRVSSLALQLFFLFVVQAHCMLPAHVILTHPLMKPLVWAFAERWPPPPPQEGLMGYDLPFWVLLPELLLLWLPAQASVLVLLLWLTGTIGESR